MEGGQDYQKNLSEEVSKLQRLYGGGDLNKFPDFKFTGSFISSSAFMFPVGISIHL